MSDQDFLTPKYENRDVVEITGIPVGTVQNWVNRGFFRLGASEQAPGSGGRRLYCLLDLVLLETARVLIENAVPISSAMLFVNAARGPLENLMPLDRTVAKLATFRYVVIYRDRARGESFVVEFPKGLDGLRQKIEHLAEGHKLSDLFFTICFGNIVNRISENTAALERNRQS
jgi:DNA-binding transcriptional MerR regulator